MRGFAFVVTKFGRRQNDRSIMLLSLRGWRLSVSCYRLPHFEELKAHEVICSSWSFGWFDGLDETRDPRMAWSMGY